MLVQSTGEGRAERGWELLACGWLLKAQGWMRLSKKKEGIRKRILQNSGGKPGEWVSWKLAKKMSHEGGSVLLTPATGNT